MAYSDLCISLAVASLDGKSFIVIMSLLAGVVGTGLGGIIGVAFRRRGNITLSRLLGFAGGIMAGVVCYEMIPESISNATLGDRNCTGVLIGVGSVIVGITATVLINFVTGKLGKSQKIVGGFGLGQGLVTTQNSNTAQDRNGLLKAGIVMLFAIGLHNFPEGMAIGASGTSEVSAGVLIAVIIAIHNVPEGMAIGAPLASGGMKSGKVIALSCFAGATTVVGAVVGMLVGGMGSLAIGICMGLASGAMLYVTVFELLPSAVDMQSGKVPSTSFLSGVVLSAVFVFLFA